MKKRTKGFLCSEEINHDSEIFDYIRELHGYLWRIVHAVKPGISGSLTDYIDDAVSKIEELKNDKENKEKI